MNKIDISASSFSGLAARVSGEGAEAWEIHRLALERKDAGEDVLILSIGEDANAHTPAHIVEAGVQSMNAGRHHYSEMEGTHALRTAITDHHNALTGRSTTPDHCVVFAGAQNALFATSLCLLEAGDEVIIIEPYYSTYPATFSAAGAAVVKVSAPAENGFEPRLSDIEAAISPSTRVIVLNSPNNPTGAIYSEALVKAVAGLCRNRDIWLISDEVYADFVFHGRHISPSGFMEPEEKCIVASSLSKSHRMSGWRMGWVICPLALSRRFSALALCLHYGLPPFVQDAAVVALTGPQDETVSMVKAYGERADLVVERLSSVPGLGVFAPNAGMFAMLDVSALTPDATVFAQALLEEANISILPCGSFGDNIDHLLRMSLCTSQENLHRACDAIEALCRRLGT